MSTKGKHQVMFLVMLFDYTAVDYSQVSLQHRKC